jgi:hypothetical protein
MSLDFSPVVYKVMVTPPMEQGQGPLVIVCFEGFTDVSEAAETAEAVNEILSHLGEGILSNFYH